MIPLVHRFAQLLTLRNWFPANGHVLVACSAGADSTALLILLHRTRLVHGCDVSVLHCAHGLRGLDGQLDARFVADLTASLKVPFAFRSFDAREMRIPGESLEQTGRRLRYDALLGLAVDFGPRCRIVTGHTMDDQAETVLLNLRRHSGRLRGGIREERPDGIVRPLLSFRRAELRAYLEKLGIGWRDDLSNLDTRFARNHIRSEVLPRLESESPGTTERLARAGRAWSTKLEKLDKEIDRELAFRRLSVSAPLPRSFFREKHHDTLARLLIRAAGIRGSVPGKKQLARVLLRLASEERSFEESFAGLRLIASEWIVSLVNAARLNT